MTQRYSRTRTRGAGFPLLVAVCVALLPSVRGGPRTASAHAATATPARVSIASPAAGTVLPWGETTRVAWTNPDLGTRVRTTRVSLSLDGGLHWRLIAALDANPGSYDWKVHEVPGVRRRCLLRVTLHNARGEIIGRGRTGGLFTINGVVSRYGLGAAEAWHLQGYRWGKAAAGDLDGDGRTEIAVLSFEGDTCFLVHVLRREPDGTLPIVSTITTFGLIDLKDIAVGDLNGDGRDDLALTGVSTLGGSMLGRLLALYQDQATGAIAATSDQKVYSSDRVGEIEIGDFGGTSGNDVAGLAEPTFAGNPGAVSVFLQTPTGALLYEQRHDACTVLLEGGLRAGDVNADGLADLVLQSGPRELAVILQDRAAPAPGFAVAPQLVPVAATTAPPVSGFDIGDLDNNGLGDLAVAVGDALRIFRRGADGAFGTPLVVPLAVTPREVRAADFDGDGLTDILVDRPSGIAAFRQRCDHTFQAPLLRTVPCQSAGLAGPGSLFQSDVNDDGVPDVVVSGWNGQLSFVFGTSLR